MVALERLEAGVVALVVLEVVLVLCDELARVAGQLLLRLHVHSDVNPIITLFVRLEGTIMALVKSLLLATVIVSTSAVATAHVLRRAVLRPGLRLHGSARAQVAVGVRAGVVVRAAGRRAGRGRRGRAALVAVAHVMIQQQRRAIGGRARLGACGRAGLGRQLAARRLLLHHELLVLLAGQLVERGQRPELSAPTLEQRLAAQRRRLEQAARARDTLDALEERARQARGPGGGSGRARLVLLLVLLVLEQQQRRLVGHHERLAGAGARA